MFQVAAVAPPVAGLREVPPSRSSSTRTARPGRTARDRRRGERGGGVRRRLGRLPQHRDRPGPAPAGARPRGDGGPARAGEPSRVRPRRTSRCWATTRRAGALRRARVRDPPRVPLPDADRRGSERNCRVRPAVRFPGHVRRDDPREAWPARTAYRREAGADRGEGVVAPRSSPRPHLQGFPPLEVPMQRTLCSDLPAAEPGSTVRLQGWVHRRRELARPHVPGGARPHRPRPGRGPRRAAVPPEETTVEVIGTATANAQAPGGVEVTDAEITLLTEPPRRPPVELWRPDAERRAADAARPRAGGLAAPGAEGAVGAGRGLAARVPRHARRGRVHRDPDAQVRGVRDRVGRQRLRGRLLRPAGVPRAEPAVLQAADGRRLRAGLRGRPGVPGRAARHRAPPGRVRLARRRARLHRRPPRRARGAARRGRRHGRRRSTSTPGPRSS